ncbi:dynein regulatory complex subunit 4-like isoform X2 [Etheostoma cragini]|uniref:dynein regulatory complex subunit 4-like isoform X2 n=1 Tax=Etheostoma cragini TaxID=417921 RepID=UPI00155E7885|nr:dynein regulatory complex subunit 4-like isoform X2 [Etheostoma cragini]
MMPKTKTEAKGGKQKKDKQPKEKTPKAQTEDETKETIKEKLPAVLDRPPTVEKNKDEMWEDCANVQEEFYRVLKQKMHFKMEKDKAHRSWDNSKRNLDEAKASMREGLRLKQEAERHRHAEIKEHELKLKQLETAHHNEICELKVANISRTSKTKRGQVESEVVLQKKIYILQADMGERDSYNKIFIRKVKQRQQDGLRKLNDSDGKRVREMEAKCILTMKIMVKENHQNTKTEQDEIDKHMKMRIVSVVAEQNKACRNLTKPIEDKRHVSLEKERLETELEAAKGKGELLDWRLAAAVQKNKSTTESLQEVEPKLSESRTQLVKERKDMAKSLKSGKKMSAHILRERRELYLKHQQLELKNEQVQQEYDELQERQTEAILDVQQKRDLKALVLERKIKAMTEMQEKEQLELWVALAFGQGDQTAAINIKEFFETKENTIRALKAIVSRELKEYEDLVKNTAVLGIFLDKWLPLGEIKNSMRNASEDRVPLQSQNFDNLMQELTALCISEDDSVQKGALGLNPVSASPDSELLQLSGASGWAQVHIPTESEDGGSCVSDQSMVTTRATDDSLLDENVTVPDS